MVVTLSPQHGGNLQHAIREYGIPQSDWLDISTGISPFVWPVPSMPLEVWQRLPEQDGQLESAALSYYGADGLAVPGSQWAIQQLPTLFNRSRVWLAQESYEEYRFWWQQHGHQLNSFSSLPSESCLQQGDIVVVINPNNPTAVLHSPSELLRLAQLLAQRDGWLIVDEAFMDATPEHSLLPYLAEQKNLVVLRSMGKFFGLAGIRMGFVFAQQGLLDILQSRLGPWGISHPAQWLATQALGDSHWQQLQRQRLLEHSQQLQDILTQHFAPASVTKSSLFCTVKLDQPVTEHWQHKLAQQGIWIRSFPQWQRLRFGLADRDGLARLEQALC